jgi:hypothetical protein
VTDSTRLTREQLYDRVWSTPLSKLGPELGMSGRGLAKLCKREGIPVPNRGYWAKKEFGWNPTQPKLPPPQPGQLATIEFSLLEAGAGSRTRPGNLGSAACARNRNGEGIAHGQAAVEPHAHAAWTWGRHA